MKKTLLYIVVVGMISMTSCNKFLNVVPEDFVSPENYFETEDEANFALSGIYSTMTQNATYASYMLGRMGLEGDESWNHYTGDRFTVADNNYGPNESRILANWREWYAGINRANIFLENIDRVAMDEDRKRSMIGQALFLRAYFYLMLVNRFGAVPLILESIKTSDVESLQIPQTPAKQIYDKIIADMEEAADMVDDITTIGYGGRVSKSAIWGVLARTCLYVAGNPINDVSRYEEARDWAKKVMDTGAHRLNTSFPQVFINHVRDIYDIEESIWEVEFWGNGTGVYANLGGYVGRNNGIGNTQDPNVGYAVGATRIARPLYFKFKSDDLRRDWAIAPFRYVGNPADTVYWESGQLYQRYCGKWRRTYELILPRSTTRTATNFPLLRYSDVLLMFAEAENEVNGGPTEEAYEAINQVKRRAYGYDQFAPNTDIDEDDLSYQEFLEYIQDERSRELAFEGLRKSDLVRWGIYVRNMQYIAQDVAPLSGDFYDFPRRTFGSVTERHTLWPIPTYEMGLNPHLVQNPGW